MKSCQKKKKKGKEYNPWFSRMFISSSIKLLKYIRWSSLIMGITNIGIIIMGLILSLCGYLTSCTSTQLFPFYLLLLASAVRIFAMIKCAVEQKSAATAILSSSPSSSLGVSILPDEDCRRQRRLRYKKWVWWTRFATVVIVLQFLLVIYLVFVLAKTSGQDSSVYCGVGTFSNIAWWNQHLMICFLMIVSFVSILQCFSSSDVLRWRSFYEVHNNAWKAHYQEVFDHGIREALCCLGRIKYLNTMEEDEVHSVAQLLGDLVTYRASGTGHLELLAGLALLQRHNQCPKLDENSVDAPVNKIQEAAAFHPFAEAAYTGPLLDVGRNPILFPCAWLYRQGILTAWSRNRRPMLQGDNWWRGHAAAFLRYVKISPESLRKGRVNPAKCQAAYFIVVLHHLRSIVIAVRGTETPEDLITDGLCRETSLTEEDLDGLINGLHISPSTRQHILSSFPHHGHSGIIEAARELYNEIEGDISGEDGVAPSRAGGFLSSLIGAGCECEGYAVQIVGHSLGGAIAALLGIRLRGRFSNLKVCAYGPLPCVDSVIADACSDFVTSIVHNSEFSSYLSINSILRLRAAALTTMSQGGTTDSAIISKLAQLFLYVSKYQNGAAMRPLASGGLAGDATNSHTDGPNYNDQLQVSANEEHSFLHEESITIGNDKEIVAVEDFANPFATDGNPAEDPVTRFLDAVPSSVRRSCDDPPEVFLPGLVIHLIRKQRGIIFPIWRGWGVQEREAPYRAIIADRGNFSDILISPLMFLDHLPWRCQYALQKVLEFQNAEMSNVGLQIV